MSRRGKFATSRFGIFYDKTGENEKRAKFAAANGHTAIYIYICREAIIWSKFGLLIVVQGRVIIWSKVIFDLYL